MSKVRYQHKTGYIVVRDDDYPTDLKGVQKKLDKRIGVYVYEHYLVWWKHNQNRPVQKHEILHHVDGDKSNNKITNLQLVLKRDHITSGRFNHVQMVSPVQEIY